MNTGSVSGPARHLGIAEHGKVCALKGDHAEALRHYREALRMSVQGGDSEVFHRHYSECALEALERLGHHAEVLEFCTRAEAHYTANPPTHPIAALDRATLRQRAGVNLLKAGKLDAAREALTAAVASAPASSRLPLAESLLRWLRSGMSVPTRRVVEEQERHGYFVVRPDMVDAARATPLPAGIGLPPTSFQPGSR